MKKNEISKGEEKHNLKAANSRILLMFSNLRRKKISKEDPIEQKHKRKKDKSPECKRGKRGHEGVKISMIVWMNSSTESVETMG